MNQQLLAVLADERRRSIARDFAAARRVRLRRTIARAVYAFAAGARTLAALVDEPGTVGA